jgi:hypothetical protein
MSERVRPTTPVGIPYEVSGVLEQMTKNVRRRPGTSEPMDVVHAASRVGRRSGSVGSNVRKMTPTVNYPGYREMISRLQEGAAEDIQLRIRNVIEARLTSPVSSTREMEKDDLTFRQYDDDKAQYQVSNDQQDNNHFYTGFNSSMKKPKTKYYAVRRGRNTGLFHDWKSCEQQVEGYSNSEFKSFQSERDALEYLAEASVNDKSEYGEKAYGSMLSQPLSQQEHDEHRFSPQIRNPERVSEQLRSVQKAKPKPTGDREHHVSANGNDGRNGFVNGRNEGRPANGHDGRNGFVNGRNEGRPANGNDGRNGFVNGRNEGRHHNSSTNVRQSYGQSAKEISHLDRDDDDRDRDQPSMDSRSYVTK